MLANLHFIAQRLDALITRERPRPSVTASDHNDPCRTGGIDLLACCVFVASILDVIS